MLSVYFILSLACVLFIDLAWHLSFLLALAFFHSAGNTQSNLAKLDPIVWHPGFFDWLCNCTIYGFFTVPNQGSRYPLSVDPRLQARALRESECPDSNSWRSVSSTPSWCSVWIWINIVRFQSPDWKLPDLARFWRDFWQHWASSSPALHLGLSPCCPRG